MYVIIALVVGCGSYSGYWYFKKPPEAPMKATGDQDTQHSGGSGKHSVDYSDIEDSDIDSDSD